MKPPPSWGSEPPLAPPPPPWPPARPAPPRPTPPTPPPVDEPGSGRRWLVGAAIGAALVLVLAVVASGPAGLGRERGHPDHGSVALRATIGALLALAGAALVAFVVRRVTARDRDRADTTRMFLGRALPWITAALALGAVLGAASAPLYREGTSDVDDSNGEPVDPRLPTYEAQLARDASGAIRVQIDPEGDGTYEMLIPCPAGTRSEGANEPPGGFAPSPDDPALVPIDYECDGVIDAYARVESYRLQPPGSPRGPTGTPGAGGMDTDGNPVDGDIVQLDGKYYRDPDGVVRLYLDMDGDGTFETPTEPCPYRGSRPPTSRGTNDPLLAPIDVDCDGTIDAYARVDTLLAERNPNPRSSGAPGLSVDDIPPATSAPSRGGPTTTEAPLADETDDRSDDDGTSLLPAVLLVALIGALLVIVVVLVTRRTRRPAEDPPVEPPAPTDDAATQALVSSLEDLARPEDPRAAIVNAYARLLDRLSDAGVPRRASETPGAYLDRCVGQLDLPRAPMAELTELFTVARFSTHTIDEAQRARAAALFEESVNELRRRSRRLSGVSP